MIPKNSSELESALGEAKALKLLLYCVYKEEMCDDVGSLVLPFFDGLHPEDPESHLRYFAMAHLLGRVVAVPDLGAQEEASRQFFVKSARAWMLWRVGQPEEARITLTNEGAPSSHREGTRELHRMALDPWYLGIYALLREDRGEARRYFRRSIELGSQLGTETNNAIQWAFVSTFLNNS